MQFKNIVLALAAVGCAVASPIDNEVSAASTVQMQNEAMEYARKQAGQVPNQQQIQAISSLQTQYPDWGYCNSPKVFPDPFGGCCAPQWQPQPWGVFDWYNYYCYNQGWDFNTWSNWCLTPSVQNNVCNGLVILGCGGNGGLLGGIL